MSVVVSAATEVEEVEISPPNAKYRLRGRKVVEEEAAGKLQLEILERVEDILEKIGKILSRNFHKLPTKAQELGSSTGPGDLLQRLNLLTRDRVLDEFLQENRPCRQLFSELLSSRYSYLKEQQSTEDTSGDGDQEISLAASFSEDFQLRDSAKTDGIRWLPIVKENGDVESTVTMKQGRRLRPLATDLTSKDAILECVDAYDGFDPIYGDSVGAFSIADPISLHELELVEKMYSHMDTLLSNDSIDEVAQGVPNMAPQPKEALVEVFAKLSDLSEKFQQESQTKIFSQLPAKSGIELKMTIERHGLEESADRNGEGVESMDYESEPSQNLTQQPVASITPTDSQLQPYKDWHIEGPKVQLARAKNFLADCDIDRTADWKHKIAELTEYLAYLGSKAQGDEDWFQDLEDVHAMLQAHAIFEDYHYGEQQLIVDFPTEIWPTQSKRLPPLPGPDITLRPRRRDLTAPRRLLHVDVASAYDQQYELPAEVLRRDYLEPYWEDSEKFWAAGPCADATEPVNLAACENEAYEECVDGDMAQTVKFLEGKGSFYPPQSHDSALKVNRGILEAFARFHGGKRAAVQQCLNIFNHDENRKMCSSLRVLALPEPVGEKKKKKSDAGIFFTTKKLANPPEKESRDPWAYTRSYQQFKNEQLLWAQRVKVNSIRKSTGVNEVSIDLPKNWKGPVLPDQMSPSMRKIYEHLRRCQKIYQGLKRAANRAPRDFITRLLEAVEAGLAGERSATKEMSLRFGEHEYEPTNKRTLANIRPTEAAWLEYTCQPSRNRPYMLDESLGRLGEIMLSRVARMMNDISPVSLFWDMKPKTMHSFLKELNVGCRGPVKRYKFTDKDVKLLAPKLQDLKILRLYTNVLTGEWMFGRPETEFHPEDLVRWPDYEPQQQQQQSQFSDDDFSEQISVVLGSSGDFCEYPKDMPRREDVISLRDFIKNPVRSAEWHKRTMNFFYCLGYRLGQTLKTLKKRVHEENQEKIRDTDTQGDNDSVLRAAISRWEDDAERLPNDPLNCPVEETSPWRMTMKYQDVIKTADPDTYERYQSKWAEDGLSAWKEASEIVRKNLLREAYENKTMLWPLPLPYNSYTTNYQVADPTSWRERLARYWKGKESMEAYQARVDALDAHIQKEEQNSDKHRSATATHKQNLKTTRREPIWTFGHPSRKKAVHLFWDINNWPVHLQSERRRKIIASRGPKKEKNGDDVANNKEATVAFAERMEIEGDEISFYRKAMQRRKFIPGIRGFMMGDTPRQKKEFETRMKMKLVPTGSKKRTWKDVLKSVVLGSPAKRKAEAISDDLPPLEVDQIPQSRPAKRRRAQTLLQNMSKDKERDLFAMARGEKGIRDAPSTVPIYARGMPLEMGKVTYYIPDTRIHGDYMMDIDEPMIELGLPTKK